MEAIYLRFCHFIYVSDVLTVRGFIRALTSHVWSRAGVPRCSYQHVLCSESQSLRKPDKTAYLMVVSFRAVVALGRWRDCERVSVMMLAFCPEDCGVPSTVSQAS